MSLVYCMKEESLMKSRLRQHKVLGEIPGISRITSQASYGLLLLLLVLLDRRSSSCAKTRFSKATRQNE